MEGYSKLAVLMSRNNEVAILRRFGELNFKNLLYLQAELVELEEQLQRLAVSDHASSEGSRRYNNKHWGLLSDTEPGNQQEQWKKWLEIRAKLKEYNEFLEQQTKLSRLGRPSKYDLDFLRDWLVRPDMGNFPIIGNDRKVWDKELEDDLITAMEQQGSDVFGTWVSNTLIPTFHTAIGKRFKETVTWDPNSGISWYSDKRIHTILDALGTVVSCLFPVASIVALYLIRSMAARLGFIAAFTAVFSLCLAVMTKARRVEIFAATTAFAAVQVVFISANGGSTLNS